MRTLKEVMNESYLASRMKGYGKYSGAKVVDYMNVKGDLDTLKGIANEFAQALEDCDNKCFIYFDNTVFNPNDFSWVADGLRHLDLLNTKVIRVDIDTQYKYKNRFHPTLVCYCNNRTEIHWNMKTQSWE